MGKIDQLGRVTIPMSIRARMELTAGERLDVELRGDEIVFFKPNNKCTFCDAREKLISYKHITFCGKCAGIMLSLQKQLDQRDNALL